jgi:hypothetical protein
LNRMLQREHIAPLRFAMWHDRLADTRPNSLHTTGPSQSLRVDKPHPASIAATQPAVAGCVRKDVAQVEWIQWDGPCVADGYNWQFSSSQDTLNRNDVQYRVPVVEIIYNSRSYFFQPSCKTKLVSIRAITTKTVIN